MSTAPKHFMPDLKPTYKIFLEVNQAILLNRRIQRDLLERGYTSAMSIIKKDAEYVSPAYITWIEPTKQFADIIINNDQDYEATAHAPIFTIYMKKMLEAIINRKIT